MNGGREREASRPPRDQSFDFAGFFAALAFFLLAGFLLAVFGAPAFVDFVVGFFAAVAFFFAAIRNLLRKA